MQQRRRDTEPEDSGIILEEEGGDQPEEAEPVQQVDEDLPEESGYEEDLIDDDDDLARMLNDDDHKNRRNSQHIQFCKLMVDTKKSVPDRIMKDNKKKDLVWSMVDYHRQLTDYEDEAILARRESDDWNVVRTALWEPEGDILTQNDVTNILNFSNDLAKKSLHRGERTQFTSETKNINTKQELVDNQPPKPEVPAGGILAGIGQKLGYKKRIG